jgi:hypothetical protein
MNSNPPMSPRSKNIKKKPKTGVYPGIRSCKYNRSLGLTYLTSREQLEIHHQNSHLRILDFNFPIHCPAPGLGEMPSIEALTDYPVLTRLNMIKRSNTLFYTAKGKKFICKVQENNAPNQAWKGFENYDLCQKIFLENADPRTRALAGSLERYIKYVESIEKFNSIIGINDDIVKNCYVQEIKRSHLNYIKFFPYLMVKFEYDLSHSKSLISEIHINQKLVFMLGLTRKEFLHSDSTNFGQLNYFRTDDLVGFHRKLLNFIASTERGSVMLTTDEFYCVNAKGDRVKGNFLLIKEKKIVRKIPTDDIYLS